MKDDVKKKTIIIMAMLFFIASFIPILGPMFLACSMAYSYRVFSKYGIYKKEFFQAMFLGQLMHMFFVYVFLFSLFRIFTYHYYFYIPLLIAAANYLLAILPYFISLQLLKRRKIYS